MRKLSSMHIIAKITEDKPREVRSGNIGHAQRMGNEKQNLSTVTPSA